MDALPRCDVVGEKLKDLVTKTNFWLLMWCITGEIPIAFGTFFPEWQDLILLIFKSIVHWISIMPDDLEVLKPFILKTILDINISTYSIPEGLVHKNPCKVSQETKNWILQNLLTRDEWIFLGFLKSGIFYVHVNFQLVVINVKIHCGLISNKNYQVLKTTENLLLSPFHVRIFSSISAWPSKIWFRTSSFIFECVHT